jgi:hypothetical protein
MLLQWPTLPFAIIPDWWLRYSFLGPGIFDVYSLPAPLNRTGYLLIPYSVFSIRLTCASIVPAQVLFEAHCYSQ